MEVRFRKDVADQVKGSLLMDSLGQVSEDHGLSPISEPDLDPTAIVVPDEGPMTFEFNIEVRPEFDLPQWKGLKIERPTKEFTKADINAHLKDLLTEHGRLVPTDDAAAKGDFVTVDVTFSHNGVQISKLDEQTIRIRPVLSFKDGKIEGFDKLMAGPRPATRGPVRHSSRKDAKRSAAGQKVSVEFAVKEVKKLEMPELTPAFLDEIGGFNSEDELRDALRESLERRFNVFPTAASSRTDSRR